MRALRRPTLVAVVCSAMLLVGVGPARADVTTVSGSAYGYFSSISLLGTPPSARGPTPTVTLPPGGSAAPVTATAPVGSAVYGPATVFTSGPITVSTTGTTGPSGSVMSSTNIANVNASTQEAFTAANVSSTCTASQAGTSGSTTITGGTLQTDNGDDDPTNSIPDHPPVDVTLPASPAAGTSYLGHLHIGSTTDNFRYAFNEQIANAGGSVTVNAGHEYLLGPAAVGDLIIGQSACGVSTVSPPPPPPVDKIKPRLSSLLVAPAGFRAAGTAASTAARVGSRISYRLSEPAAVKFRIQRASPGRRVRGRCVRPRRSNRRARRCRRYVTMRGSFTHHGKAGRNRFKFRGRLRGRKLRPGRYRLRAVAKDPAGNKSRAKTRRFRIVRR